jgi:hypothetical protein
MPSASFLAVRAANPALGWANHLGGLGIHSMMSGWHLEGLMPIALRQGGLRYYFFSNDSLAISRHTD